MANRKRAEARRKAAAKAARTEGEGGGGKGALWGTLVVVLALVVGVIVWAANRSDSTATTSSSTPTGSTAPGLPDSQPVKVTGKVLDQFDSAKSPDPAVGKVAPILDGKDFQGNQMLIDATKKGPIMLVFLAHWCPHCNREVPRLNTWKHSGQVPAELNVIGVTTAVSKSSPNYPPAQWISDKGWEWPVLADQSTGDGTAGIAAEAMGASGWPYFVIIGKDGKVKVRVSGEVEVTELQKIVTAALAG
jgi:thiol-disulfide isomerase/thioredoxin